MLYNDFHGAKISRLGFGLMRLPVQNNDQSQVDYDKVEEMLLYAYDHGINYYDTAYPYHNGFSEKTLGAILTNNHLHGKVNIATKLFTMGLDKPDYDPRKIFEEQISRLQTEHIDFYLVHGLHGQQWETLCEKFDIKNFLSSLKEQGIIGNIGFSFHDNYDCFCRIIDDFEWDFAQIQYNYLDNEIQAGDKGFAYAREKGVPLSIMEPLKGGNLIFPDYPEVEAIKAKYGFADLSNAELGLGFVMDKPGLLTVLSGMSTLEQVEENIRIAERCHEGMMTEAHEKCIAEIRELLTKTENIPCTGCRYCTAGCPAHIQIPVAFSSYNTGKKFRNPEAQKRNFNRSCANIADCVECGQCVEACPQHLDIPALLKEVRAYLG